MEMHYGQALHEPSYTCTQHHTCKPNSNTAAIAGLVTFCRASRHANANVTHTHTAVHTATLLHGPATPREFRESTQPQRARKPLHERPPGAALRML